MIIFSFSSPSSPFTSASSLLVGSKKALGIALALSALALPAWAQTTNNSSTGATQKLTMTVTNTHGINTSASMTPDFDVVTYAKLVIKPDGSSSFQSAGDGASAGLSIGDGVSQVATRGMSGGSTIEFDRGTEAWSLITPTGYVFNKDLGENGQYVAPGTTKDAAGNWVGTRERCTSADPACELDKDQDGNDKTTGTKPATMAARNFNAVANGGAAVTSQTTLTIEQTLNEFENTLTSTLSQ